MTLNIGDLTIETQIIGGFEVNDKKYAVCSYNDSDGVCKNVIVEVYNNGGNMEVRDIPENEMNSVFEVYKEIETTLLGGDSNVS